MIAATASHCTGRCSAGGACLSGSGCAEVMASVVELLRLGHGRTLVDRDANVPVPFARVVHPAIAQRRAVAHLEIQLRTSGSLAETLEAGVVHELHPLERFTRRKHVSVECALPILDGFELQRAHDRRPIVLGYPGDQDLCAFHDRGPTPLLIHMKSIWLSLLAHSRYGHTCAL